MKLALFAALLAVSRVAAADDSAPGSGDAPVFRAPTGPDIVVEIPGDRTPTNKLALAGVAGLGVIAAGLAVYWHLDSRSIANDLAADTPTGKPWTQSDQDRYDRGQRDNTKAIVAYSIGGAALVGATIAYILTEPKPSRSVIHPHTAQVTPLPGGAMVGGMWSF